MKKLTVYPIFALAAFLFTIPFSFGQFNVALSVVDADITTTCTDPFSSPDENWSINIESQGWTTYPGNVFCPVPLPNMQYNETFRCLADIPPTIQICFRAFENDAPFFDPCNEVLTCQIEECFDVAIPLIGSFDFTLELSDGLASDGTVDMRFDVQGFPGGLFDHVCDALDLGILDNNVVIGDAEVSVYNNYCATWQNEPSPWTYGAGWINNQSIWVQFTTNDTPSSLIKIESKSDPSNLGDPINLQVAVFSTSDNTCTGNFRLEVENHDPATWDELLYLTCPEPNTTYYIIIDAVNETFEQVEGFFSLEISEMGLVDAPNFKCDALPLGVVPDGGTIALPESMTNVCATNNTDGSNPSFSVQHGVWFSFVAPLSGHVLIEGISNVEDVPIDLQFAVYASTDGTCSGTFIVHESGYDGSSFDETLEVSCLNPGQTYYLLLDGESGEFEAGIFDLSISDASDDTPVTMLDETLCFGESIVVGLSTYDLTGSYQDTIILPNGCDSIVLTELEILTDISLNFDIVQQGIGSGNTDGQAVVNPVGGAGNFSVTWDNGQSGQVASSLVGGDIYCLLVTDQNGCEKDTCFEMPYLVHFVPETTGSVLDCFGDQNGTLSFTANYGVPPYLYSWQNMGNTMSGSGTITTDGELVELDNLPAGQYAIQIQDVIFDTTVIVEVDQPTLLEVAASDIQDASCFGNCDGNILLDIIGGTPPYQTNWSNGMNGNTVSGLCSGSYSVIISDENDCTATYQYDVLQPEEFVAQGIQVQEVSCFEGNDGIATVSTNGDPISFLWNVNNETTETIEGLEGGIYEVIVTNNDGCTSVATAEITTPAVPVSVSLEISETISCKGGVNGAVQALVTGPGANFTYTWSNGSVTSISDNLLTGNYEVTVENNLGCQAVANIFLPEPNEIEVAFTSNKLSCLDPPDGGIVNIENTLGGVGPYTYSSNGTVFSTSNQVTGFIAGTQTLYVQDAGGCIKEFPITIDGPKELIVNIGQDQTVELGDEVTLNALVNIAEVSYEWFPAPENACIDCSQIEFTPTESALYSLTVTDEYDCTEVADVFITVIKKRKVFIPNAFSPNGDGFNDLFMPYTGKDVQQIKEFKIFDRQGNMVYEAGDFQPGDIGYAWDGIFKGQIMQPGVFVWFASIEFIDQEIEIFKGDLTLIR